MGLFWAESAPELNTKNADDFLLFPTVTHKMTETQKFLHTNLVGNPTIFLIVHSPTSNGQRFTSYYFWKTTGLLECSFWTD
jgi:hypothetical protein